jgi:hypothetical protein
MVHLAKNQSNVPRRPPGNHPGNQQSGVPDKTIQAILRHSNVAVTQACYIKTSNADAVGAMLTLEHATNVQLEQADAKANQQPPVM